MASTGLKGVLSELVEATVPRGGMKDRSSESDSGEGGLDDEAAQRYSVSSAQATCPCSTAVSLFSLWFGFGLRQHLTY